MIFRIEHLRAGAVQPWGRVSCIDRAALMAIAPPRYKRAVGRAMRGGFWVAHAGLAQPFKVRLRDWRGRDMGIIFAVQESGT